MRENLQEAIEEIDMTRFWQNYKITSLILSLGLIFALSLVGCQSQQLQEQRQTDVPKTTSDTTNSSTPKITNTQSQLQTWRDFVENGGNDYIRTDFVLPEEFKDGLVYFNTGANVIHAFILKQGLSSYPDKGDGLNEIATEVAEDYVQLGQAIVLQWNLGNSALQFMKDPSIRFPRKGTGCLKNICLTANFLSEAEISQILRSQHPIRNTSQ